MTRVLDLEAGTTHEGDAGRAELQERLEETRESISQTVTEIKDAVTNQYESVKDTISDAVDWREHYRERPIAWSVGALSLGALAGYYLAGNYKRIEALNHLQSEASRLGDRFIKELSDIGDDMVKGLSKAGDRVLDEMPNAARYVAPTLAAAALPLVADKIKDKIGVDVSGLVSSRGEDGRPNKGKKKGGQKKKKKKKQSAKADDMQTT